MEQDILNFVGSYLNTDYSRKYLEAKQNIPTIEFGNFVKGRRYTGIGEIAYKKAWKNLSLNTGTNIRYYYLKNSYSGNVDEAIGIHKSHINIYAELSGNINQFEYNLGISGRFSSFKESDNHYKFNNLLPKIDLRYNFSDDLSTGISGEINTIDPTPAALSDVSQSIDNFIIQKGDQIYSPTKFIKDKLI